MKLPNNSGISSVRLMDITARLIKMPIMPGEMYSITEEQGASAAEKSYNERARNKGGRRQV